MGDLRQRSQWQWRSVYEQMFTHTNMSLHFSKAKRPTENGVKISKRLLQQADIFLPLMAYWSTAISAIKSSLVGLIMNRFYCWVIPPKNNPTWLDLERVVGDRLLSKKSNENNYNRRQGTRTVLNICKILLAIFTPHLSGLFAYEKSKLRVVCINLCS